MKYIWLGIFLSIFVFINAYGIGDTVGDLSWTDNEGESHSIHELVDSGRVVFFFWGENW